MFSEVLIPTTDFDKECSLKVISKLSVLLVDEYIQRNNTKVYKKEELVFQLTNILGLLFCRFRFSQYNRRHPPIVYFPNAKNLYYNSKQYNDNRYNIVKINIESFGLTSRRKDQVLEILKSFSLCTITLGIYKLENPQTTILTLNTIEKWDGFLFTKDIVLNFGIYSALYGEYLTKRIFSKHNPLNFVSAVIKLDENTYIPANTDDIRFMDELNSLLPKELQSSLRYKKIYSKSEFQGGRLFSKINTINHETRDILLGQIGYAEVDFPSFVPNLMHRVVDGSTFPERAYTLVAARIIKDKTKTKNTKINRVAWIETYQDIIANIIKTPIITLLNIDISSSKGFKFCYLEESTKILVDHGLLNSIEDRKSTASIWKNHDYSHACTLAGEHLRSIRIERWVSKFGTEIECPHFTVSIENIYTSMVAALKAINSFILKSNWGWTQFLEAELLHDIARDIKEDNLLPIFIHDGFYVPTAFEEKYRQKAEEYITNIAREYREAACNETQINQMLVDFKMMIEKNYNITNIVNSYKTTNVVNKQNIHKISQRIHKELKKNIEDFKRHDNNIFIFCDKNYWYELELIKEIVKSNILENR